MNFNVKFDNITNHRINMKTLFFTLLLSSFTFLAVAQNDTISKQDTTSYRIVKTDGGELIGRILSQDARELLLLTEDNRQIYIPQHVIQKIIAVEAKDFNTKGEFIGEDKFSTRYFISTNGLPIKKGENYIQWNLFGPDLQFAVADNLGAGVMTSWFGIPLVGTIKKSWQINETTHFALGGLVGTGSWANIGVGGALPFATISSGNRRSNIAFSGGYSFLWGDDGLDGGTFMTSIAGMTKVSPKISLVFDSFIFLPKENFDGFAILIPGVRWHQDENKALQFGFAGLIVNGSLVPVPMPFIQWYRTL
jgi:hypothetical protein